MILILAGFANLFIVAPIVTAASNDVGIGWLTFATGVLAVVVGGYKELYSK